MKITTLSAAALGVALATGAVFAVSSPKVSAQPIVKKNCDYCDPPYCPPSQPDCRK